MNKNEEIKKPKRSNADASAKSLSSPPNNCLFLSDDVVRFEPVSEVTAVFFDESNAQLIISRSNGAGGIVVKSKKAKNLFNLRLQNLGDIASLNFSPDSRILAIKRTSSKAIDFVNVYPGFETREFSQLSKLKNSKIVGMCWVGSDEVALVADKGLEHYQVLPDKKLLKLLKSISLDVNWFLWNAESSLCILATGSMANIFQALHFKDNTFSKWTKMEIDIITPSSSSSLPPSSSSSLTPSSPTSPCFSTQARPFKQKDFMMIRVYNNTYMTRTIVEKMNCLIEVHLYAIKRDSSSRVVPEVLLLLNCSGKVVLSVVDNLIILHHHLTKTSHIYDISLDNYDLRDGLKFHLPIIPSLSIRSFKSDPSGSLNEATYEDDDLELYSSHWVIFSPDVILDAKKGFYWNLKLDLEALLPLVTDKVQLISLLLLRSHSQSLILKVLRDLLKGLGDSPLVDMGPVALLFDKINSVLANHLSPTKEERLSGQQVIGQSDMHHAVLLPLHQQQHLSDKHLNAVLLQYQLSLSNHNISPEAVINNLLIDRLLQQGKSHQLQQMLQYRLFPDSKELAIRLLSLSSSFPPANQLALDMLRRMSTSLECIFELLLSNKHVVSAIRYAHALGLSDQLKARKFLQVSMTSNDDALFYVVYHYFEDKNLKNRGSAKFLPGDQCDVYTEYYNSKFQQLTT